MGEARIARWDESKWRMIPGYPLSSNYEEGRKSGAVQEINAGLLWPRSRAFVSTSHHCVAWYRETLEKRLLDRHDD